MAIAGGIQSHLLTFAALSVAIIFPQSTFSDFQGEVDPGGVDPNDAYGSSLDRSNEWLAIGAPLRDVNALANAGVVYMFKRDTTHQWILKQEVRAPSIVGNARFGSAVAIDRNLMIVGAPRHNGSGFNTGRAYIFKLNNAGVWTHVVELAADAPQVGELFGSSVDIRMNSAVVGAPNATVSGKANAGRVIPFLYEKPQNQTQFLWIRRPTVSLDAAADANDFYGTKVALIPPKSREVTISSAGSSGSIVAQNGVAFDTEELTTPSLPQTDWSPLLFVSAIQVEDLAIPGIPTLTPSNSGAVFVYQRGVESNNWVYAGYLLSAEPSSQAVFGSALDVDADGNVLVGERYADLQPPSYPVYVKQAGRAHYFRRNSGGWNAPSMIVSPNPISKADFGSSVTLGNGFLAIGAEKEEALVRGTVSDAVGAAYLYNRQPQAAITFLATVTPEIPTQQMDFATAMVIDAPRFFGSFLEILVSARGGATNGVLNSGAVYRYLISKDAD